MTEKQRSREAREAGKSKSGEAEKQSRDNGKAEIKEKIYCSVNLTNNNSPNE